MRHLCEVALGEIAAPEAQAQRAGHAASKVQRHVGRVVQRLQLMFGDKRQQIGRRKDGAQPFDVMADVDRRRRAVVHPSHVAVAEHPEVEAIAAA